MQIVVGNALISDGIGGKGVTVTVTVAQDELSQPVEVNRARA